MLKNKYNSSKFRAKKLNEIFSAGAKAFVNFSTLALCLLALVLATKLCS